MSESRQPCLRGVVAPICRFDPDAPGGYYWAYPQGAYKDQEVVMERATISIDGMSCGHGVGQVRSALQNVPGVTVENVTVGRAEVAYDGSKVKPDALRNAVAEAGYQAKVAATSAPSSDPTPKAGGGCGCC